MTSCMSKKFTHMCQHYFGDIQTGLVVWLVVDGMMVFTGNYQGTLLNSETEDSVEPCH